jgi:hypothetical protein
MIVLIVLLLLILVPAAVAFVSETSLLSRAAFGIGAAVVYSRREMSTQLLPGAHHVDPSDRGEFYYYTLVDYLRVAEVLDDGRVLAVARDNVRVLFWPDDSQFRKARLIERFIYRWRFPHL